MAQPILISPFFTEYVLPFVLVFTLVFAVLQKTKVLGEDVKQINSIIALVTGLFLIAFPFARNIVVGLMPFLAVFAVILLVFMLLFGFVSNSKDGVDIGKFWKYFFYAILGVSLTIVILILSGYWDILFNLAFSSSSSSQILINGFLILVIAGAIIAVIWGGNKNG